jgi:hypothetical protein
VSQTVCFRCDWQGETSKPACPSCGAPLYRPEGAKRVRRVPGAAAVQAFGRRVGTALRPGGKPGAEPALETAPATAPVVRRTPPWLILGVLAIAGVAVFLVARGGRRETPQTPAAATGRLVYAGADRRLYVIDLDTGATARGPRIPIPSRIGLSATGQDSVLVSTTDRNGREKVYLVADLEPGAHPIFLGEGDLVTWDSSGRHVYALDSSPGPVEGDVCTDRHVELFSIDVVSGNRERLYTEDIPCGGVTSLVAGADSVYVTRISNGSASVRQVAPPSGELALQGYSVLAVSPGEDLLVSPFSPAEEDEHSATVLFRPLQSGLDDIRLGEGGLETERVLAWAGDSSKLAILGRVSAGLRVWMVAGGQGPDIREPEPIGPSGLVSDAAGAFDRNQTLYLVSRGEITAITDAGSFSIDVERNGAPVIAGPVAWLP